MSWSRVMLLFWAILFCGTTLLAEDRPARRKVSPVYPELARKMRVSGAVKMEVNVDPEGQVKDIKVVQGHALLRDAAVNAVKQWVFVKSPAKSIEVIEVDFKE